MVVEGEDGDGSADAPGADPSPAGGVWAPADALRIHTGSVVAGVIGKRKFSYDLWGDTVNTAARMESHGIPGEIQVTEDVYRRLKGGYRFEPRGRLENKG